MTSGMIVNGPKDVNRLVIRHMTFGFPVPAGAGGVKIHVPEFVVELGRS